MRYILLSQSFWNFAQSTTVIPSWSVQNSKMIGQVRQIRNSKGQIRLSESWFNIYLSYYSVTGPFRAVDSASDMAACKYKYMLTHIWKVISMHIFSTLDAYFHEQNSFKFIVSHISDRLALFINVIPSITGETKTPSNAKLIYCHIFWIYDMSSLSVYK